MTGGGYLVAYDSGLYERASAALVELLGGIQATAALGGAVVQVADEEGRLFTLYERVPAGTEYDAYEGPFTAAPGVQLPDTTVMIACPFDCRWRDLVSRLAALIASTADAPTWIMDGDGMFWDAKDVDPLAMQI